ncbi:MAG: UDP-3-O-(3-hydroxymyristoyl)glucosamine N-acyltransferase [Marinifilaceae bacterium]
MEFRAKDIAELLQGTVEGDANQVVNNVSKIEEGRPGTLAFLANPKYEHYIYDTDASIVLVNKDFVPTKPVKATLIRVASAYDAIATLLQMYEEMRLKPIGIEQPSYISETATYGEKIYVGAFAYVGKNVTIGSNVKIYPHAYIGDGVRIGDNCTIYSGVKIYHGCVLGNQCTIHAGTVIGADGFGFAPSSDGYNKIPQIGNVVLEDNVEVGANSCIDRATMGSTLIKKGVKLDNLIQIAHNVVVGEDTVIAAQTGIAGSAKIGANCMFGGQVGMIGHLEVGDGTMVAAQSGIATNAAPKSVLRGSPAYDLGKFQKSYVVFRKLPDIWSQIKDMQKEIKTLKLK